MVDFLHRVIDKESSPLGMISASEVDTFVYCALIGLSAKVKGLISTRIAWIDDALLHSQFPAERTAFQRSAMLKAKAEYHWLLEDASSAHRAWQEARAEHELFLLDPLVPYAEHTASTDVLDDQMALCLLAGEWERGIAMYRRFWPGKEPIPARAQVPRDWAYLACLNHLHPTLTEDDLLQSGRRMLRLWLDDPWLGRGQASRAAMWLMAVHWLPNQSLTPVQTLHKAYDDLPDVERPAFSVA